MQRFHIMKKIIAKIIVAIIISYLSACAPVDEEAVTPPTDFSLEYNSANRELSWQKHEVDEYFYQIEYSPQSDNNFTTFSTSTGTVLQVPPNISGNFRLKVCIELPKTIIECSVSSNSVSNFIYLCSCFYDRYSNASRR